MSAEDYGFKVSLPGYDVKTATPEQCAVHSSYPPLKAKLDQTPPHFAQVIVDFTGAVSQATTHTLYAINRNYGYVPLTIPSMVFFEQGGQTFSGVGEVAVGSTLDILAYATSTQFIISIYDDFFWTGANAQLDVSYYIFAENGA
jgi:hypothetical protein